MPTYDYICDACAHAFEEFQSITAKPLKKCPACGKPKLRRLIGTGAGIIFKGSGFYETDYRSDSYGKEAKADKDGGDASTDSKKADAKSDKADKTKPAEKTTAKAESSSKPTESKPAKKKG